MRLQQMIYRIRCIRFMSTKTLDNEMTIVLKAVFGGKDEDNLKQFQAAKAFLETQGLTSRAEVIYALPPRNKWNELWATSEIPPEDFSSGHLYDKLLEFFPPLERDINAVLKLKKHHKTQISGLEHLLRQEGLTNISKLRENGFATQEQWGKLCATAGVTNVVLQSTLFTALFRQTKWDRWIEHITEEKAWIALVLALVSGLLGYIVYLYKKARFLKNAVDHILEDQKLNPDIANAPYVERTAVKVLLNQVKRLPDNGYALTGIRGSGKTTSVAHWLEGQDGVLMVNLPTTSDVTHAAIWNRMASELGASPQLLTLADLTPQSFVIKTLQAAKEKLRKKKQNDELPLVVFSFTHHGDGQGGAPGPLTANALLAVFRELQEAKLAVTLVDATHTLTREAFLGEYRMKILVMPAELTAKEAHLLMKKKGYGRSEDEFMTTIYEKIGGIPADMVSILGKISEPDKVEAVVKMLLAHARLEVNKFSLEHGDIVRRLASKNYEEGLPMLELSPFEIPAHCRVLRFNCNPKLDEYCTFYSKKHYKAAKDWLKTLESQALEPVGLAKALEP